MRILALLTACLLLVSCSTTSRRGAAAVDDYSLTVCWDYAAGTADLSGFRVYCGTNSRAYTRVIEVPGALSRSCIVSGLSKDVWYFFSASTVAIWGVESDLCSEISYIHPSGHGSLLKLSTWMASGPSGPWTVTPVAVPWGFQNPAGNVFFKLEVQDVGDAVRLTLMTSSSVAGPWASTETPVTVPASQRPLYFKLGIDKSSY